MTVVLVTGVGSVTGYGLIRDLRARRPDLRLVGTDIHTDAVGAHWCDAFLPCPPAADVRYADWLRRTIGTESVDLVLPTLDADLDHFRATGAVAAEGATTVGGATVALNSGRALELSRDKLALDDALAVGDDPCRIPTSTGTDFDEVAAVLGVPFLLKPRAGHGGRGIVRVERREEFARHAPRIGAELFAQRVVGESDEITVGAFGDARGGFCARIAMRRWLAPWGTTRRVEVVDVPADLDTALGRLAGLLDPRGPTNLQFRRDGDRWWLLEVNARVSSSASLRAQFGYHDAEMALDFFLRGAVPSQPPVRFGTAVRFFEDLVTG